MNRKVDFCEKAEKAKLAKILNEKPISTGKSCLRKPGCWQPIENPSAATSHEILLQEERDCARRKDQKARELIKSQKQAKSFADESGVIADDEKPRRLLEITTQIFNFFKPFVIEKFHEKAKTGNLKYFYCLQLISRF